MDRNQHVIVVGAGAAGLAATYTLNKHGIDVILLEAKDRAGGRMTGEIIDGFHFDTGAAGFFAAYETVPRIAGELGVPLKDVNRKEHALGVFLDGKLRTLGDPYSLRRLWPNLKTLFSFKLLSPKALVQLLKLIKFLRSRREDLLFEDYSGVLDLDAQENISDFLSNRFGGAFLENFLQPSWTALVLSYPEDSSMGYGAVFMWNSFWDPSLRLITAEKGVGQLADALAEACAEQTRLGTPVERVVIEAGAVQGVVAKGEFIEADAVICALPAPLALKVAPDLPPEVSSVLGKVGYSTVCHTALAFDRPSIPQGLLVCLPQHSEASLALYYDCVSLIQLPAPEGSSLISAYAIEDKARELFKLTDSEIVDKVLAEIREYTPGVTAEPLWSRVYRWQEAVCLAPPGMLNEVYEMKKESTEVVPGLFLAGDYMQMPCTNGAMRSGVDAAEDVVRSLAARE